MQALLDSTRPGAPRASRTGGRHLLGPWLALLLVSALAACSNVTVRVDKASRMNLVEFGTYAYMDVTSATSAELEERIQAAVDEQMSAIGLTRVAREEARLLVAFDTLVEVETRYIDPFERAFYSHEKVEEGTLVLEMIDSTDDDVVWSGTAHSQLRVVARGSGVTSIQYEPTDEKPKWEVEEKVRRLLKRFPRA